MHGLIRHHVMFVIRLATREVRITGIVPEASREWVERSTQPLTRITAAVVLD